MIFQSARPHRNAMRGFKRERKIEIFQSARPHRNAIVDFASKPFPHFISIRASA